MKKAISVFMVLALIFSLTACDTNSPEYLLNNFDKFSETVSQMSRGEIRGVFGNSLGNILDEDCKVYLDSWGNGIFVYFKSEENQSFDDQSVEKGEKSNIANKNFPIYLQRKIYFFIFLIKNLAKAKNI